MYSFEGDFRRMPKQSLGGARRQLERDELLQRTKMEREQREDSRRQIHAATTIQAFIKGYVTKKKEKSHQRDLFDEIQRMLQRQSQQEKPELLSTLSHKLIFFYDDLKDIPRLSWLSQLYLKRYAELAPMVLGEPYLHRLQRFLHLNISCLVSAKGRNVPIAIPLRMVEIFTSMETYVGNDVRLVEESLQKIWLYLVEKGYYKKLRVVLEEKVPDNMEISPRPPTPLATSLLDLFLRPLMLHTTAMYRCTILRALLGDLFSSPMSPQLSTFLLPALSERPDALPLSDVLDALQNRNLLLQIEPLFGLPLAPTPYLLHSFMSLVQKQIGVLTGPIVGQYLQALSHLVQPITHLANATPIVSSDSDDESKDLAQMETEDSLQRVIQESLDLMNEPQHVAVLLSALQEAYTPSESLVALSCICHTLLVRQRLAIHKYRLLYMLAFKPTFLRQLWHSIINSFTVSVFGTPTQLLQILSRGLPLNRDDEQNFLPQICVFCALLSHLLPTLHDNEFYGEDPGGGLTTMPFTLPELTNMSLALREVCLGLIELAYPDTRPCVNEDYRNVLMSVRDTQQGADDSSKAQISTWLQLFAVTVGLLHQLYARDSRRQLFPDGHWIAHQVVIPVDRPRDLKFGSRRLRSYRPFYGFRALTREQMEEEGPPLSTKEVRHMKILQELPFVVPFPDRVKIFQSLVAKDKAENQEMSSFLIGPQIQVMIRRNYIYEDAFDKLSRDNEPNLKLRMRVQLVNVVGLDEAGIDGGGIFREFLGELLKTAFDPNRGFFKTTHDRLFYPNTGVALLMDNFPKHYFFIGRMLGKAIYENMLVELPFADFFLAKMLGKSTADVDIHHLASLDPVIYKNLLYLKNYDGDVAELGLDFTVMNSELGENQVVELKPGGASIPVTATNRIEYIHLMADYKLNKQIRAQCAAFKQGLADVLDLEWLRMFDSRELQVLVSGAYTPVDIDDLRTHTNYAGGYSSDHPVIKAFWKVVERFNEKQRRQLLKFVTSCSRPPLLGFRELSPTFCIQYAGNELDRLPTASTCMNLLKLPEFKDEKTLYSKLLYAIESGAGFELS